MQTKTKEKTQIPDLAPYEIELEESDIRKVQVDNPVVKLLKEAREHLSDKDNWCQFVYSNSRNQYCAVGALYHFGGETQKNVIEARMKLEQAAHRKNPAYGILGVNDSKGYEAVLEVYDEAINIAEKECNT